MDVRFGDSFPAVPLLINLSCFVVLFVVARLSYHMNPSEHPSCCRSTLQLMMQNWLSSLTLQGDASDRRRRSLSPFTTGAPTSRPLSLLPTCVRPLTVSFPSSLVKLAASSCSLETFEWFPRGSSALLSHAGPDRVVVQTRGAANKYSLHLTAQKAGEYTATVSVREKFTQTFRFRISGGASPPLGIGTLAISLIFSSS